ncbi:MAG TPA: HAD-IIIA family hydrolase [Usitatibacter sp.]|nr:HAD-IIIA family hydrolase [Usitatibacter sp.]
MRPAVFLEKDGTLLEKVTASGDRRIRLRPGAVDALLLLSGMGYEVFVVSNQPGVARGEFPYGALDAVAAHLDDLFLAHGFKLSGCYWCPHDPDGIVMEYSFDCACRKPMPGLIEAAARENDIDLTRSWLIGGDVDDIEAGVRAGCNTVWIGDEDDAVHRSLADLVAPNLLEAAARIMRARESRRDTTWTRQRSSASRPVS